MTYRQLNSKERYMLAALRRQGLNQSQVARSLGRHRPTVCREVGRNGPAAGATPTWRGFLSPSKNRQSPDW